MEFPTLDGWGLLGRFDLAQGDSSRREFRHQRLGRQNLVHIFFQYFDSHFPCVEIHILGETG